MDAAECYRTHSNGSLLHFFSKNTTDARALPSILWIRFHPKKNYIISTVEFIFIVA